MNFIAAILSFTFLSFNIVKSELTNNNSIIGFSPKSTETNYNETSDILDENKKCHFIWTQPNPCEYAAIHCSHLTEGFVNYIDLYYCKLEPTVGNRFGGLIISFILGLVFLFLGTIASDFFCPNLSALAKYLNLSESVAGVTLLAFGNGSPDLFSTFSALKSGSGALAVGELIGASWFIISVVVGSMAIISSFRVVRSLFLRDLLFFTGAMLFMIFILWDRQLTPTEALFLVCYYITYVLSVVLHIPSEEESADETASLLPQPALSNRELIPLAAPSTYYKRMNFWTIDEISRAFKLGAGDLHPGSARLFRRRSQFLPASAKLNCQFFQRTQSLPDAKRRSRSVSSDFFSGSTSTHLNDYFSYERDENTTPKSPIVTGLSVDTRKNGLLSPGDPTIESPRDFLAKDIESKDDSLLKVLFPLIYEWNDLAYHEQLLNFLCIPFIFILTLTIPLPSETDTEASDRDSVFSNVIVFSSDPQDKVNPGWILLSFQAFIIPIFLSKVVLIDNGLFTQYGIYWAIFIGIIFVALINFVFPSQRSQEELVYKYPFIISFTGFSLALCWISLVATEVVDILKVIGIILGIHEEIIGLTVFAMGNSLGDFVANLSVARMGYPTMAVSACFAGPMLNLMLGPGLSGAYIGFSRGENLFIPVTQTMMMAAVGTLVTLVLYIIYVHTNRCCIGRKFGIGLICLYFLGMFSSIVLTD